MRRTIERRRLLERGASVLVACSGGPDSVALTHIVSRLARDWQLRVQVASVDHGLRADSSRDIEVARSVSHHLGVPFYALKVEVAKGASVQSHARRARYEALEHLRRELGCEAIAVGHTADDQAETVVSRLLRGTGISGLSGIAARRHDGVIRPLLDCSRSAIREYVRDHRLSYVQDPSNEDTRYLRTRIRATILPLLVEEDPQIVSHLVAIADDARSVSHYLRSQAKDIEEVARSESGALEATKIRGLPSPLRRAVLQTWIARETGLRLRRPQIVELEGLLRGHGEVWLQSGWSVFFRGTALELARRDGGHDSATPTGDDASLADPEKSA